MFLLVDFNFLKDADRSKTKTFQVLTIHPFLQLLARFEKRQFFRFDLNLLPCFGITAGIPTVFFNENGKQAPDFNSVSLCKRLGHFIEKKGHDLFSFGFC